MDTPANSLDHFPPERYAVLGFSNTCDHRAPLDRTLFLPGATVQALRGRLRCFAGGHRFASIRIAYKGGWRVSTWLPECRPRAS